MRSALLLARRELASYVRSWLGVIAAPLMLLVTGILFYVEGLGSGAKLSAEVLMRFFYNMGGVNVVAAIILSMRLIAGERENGSIVLLNTAPIKESEVVVGKFLAAFSTIGVITAISVYMPLLIFVNGRVSAGHILIGYLGVLLL